jgi:threonine synthase
VVFCVPSGNFGNLTAGLIAKRMGLDIKHFIAATNVNDIVPQYLSIGKYLPRPSVSTIANAMDVGDPSNFVRILDLYNNSHEAISRDITGYSYTDDQIRTSISDVYKKHSYLLDPHGATGFMASEKYLNNDPSANLVFLETAHPAKFRETVEEVIGSKLELPERLKVFEEKEKKSILLGNTYEQFREYLGKIEK